MPPERTSGRRAALKRQRAIGETDTKAAMKVLEKYVRKKYRQSVFFASREPSEYHLSIDPQTLSEPFTPRTPKLPLGGGFAFENTTTVNSCPPDQTFTLDLQSPKLKEEIKHKNTETWSEYIWRVFKHLYKYLGLKHVVLILVLICYAMLGGFVFNYLEKPEEIRRETDFAVKSLFRHANYSTRLFNMMVKQSCTADFSMKRAQEFSERCNMFLGEIFADYDKELLHILNIDTVWKWDFFNAVFYSGTIFTTIGYGNISCRTKKGRYATILYALFGVPLMLVVLNSLGKLMFQSVQAFWEKMRSLARRCLRHVRKRVFLRRTPTVERVPSDELIGITQQNQGEDSLAEQDLFTTFPMSLALCTVFLYISLCSFMFTYWEDWDYSTAFYFFFISLSTVGLGDEMPKHPKRACAFFLFFIIGLSLVSMCISILQARMENKYMKALDLIDKVHQSAEGEEEADEEEEGEVSDTVPMLDRPAHLPALHGESVRWRRSRFASATTTTDRSDSDFSHHRRSTILMSSPMDNSPVVPPPTVLGVFMARSMSSRNRQLPLQRSDSTGSKQSSRRYRPSSSTSEDLIMPVSRHQSPTSVLPRSDVLLLSSAVSGSAPNLAPTRPQHSLEVITEGNDDEEVYRPPPPPPPHPSRIGTPIEVPEVKIELAQEEEDRISDEEDAKSNHSSSCLSVDRIL